MEAEAIREAISENLESVRSRIAAAAGRAGRDPQAVALIAISKTVEPERVLAAHDVGLAAFGENRVEEAECKIPVVNKWVEERGGQLPSWHLVGHLQSRKSVRALEIVDLIESLDSIKLAERLSRQAGELGKVMPVLLELNVSGEESKYGFPVAGGPGEESRGNDFLRAFEEILGLPNLDVRGLMTVAPMSDDAERARPYFQGLREWRDRLNQRFPTHLLTELSMGMTDDFEVAVEEGATMLRLGRAIFGPRPVL